MSQYGSLPIVQNTRNVQNAKYSVPMWCSAYAIVRIRALMSKGNSDTNVQKRPFSLHGQHGQQHLYTYSLFQKKRTFNSEFFCSPPWGWGPKIHMVYYVNRTPIYIICHVNFWPSSPRGRMKKFGIKCAFLLE